MVKIQLHKSGEQTGSTKFVLSRVQSTIVHSFN